jgi:dephospho-CoA kinase
MAHPAERVCVDGIRVPAHSMRLRELCGSKILALHCPPELRFVRACERGGDLDKRTLEAFLKDEAQEARNPDPYVQSTLTVMEMADYRIDGSQPLPNVLEAVDRIVPLVVGRSY